MAVNSHELISKINIVRASRYLMRNKAIEEHFPLSNDQAQINQTVHEMIFAYIRNKFQGCRIRPGEQNFSVRLDAEIHQKARKLREVMSSNPEWKRWFDENHRHITDSIANNNSPFQDSNYVEYSVTDDKYFIRVPFIPSRIRQYSVEGVMKLFQWLDEQYTKDLRLSGLYQTTVDLMENEIRRREEARRQRIERERTSYLTGLRERLIKPIAAPQVDRSSTSAEAKFKVKMWDWCVANGVSPAYAEELTPEIMVPKTSGVRMIAREGEREKEWFAVPMFGGYEMPEGYVLKDRWGKVSDHNSTDKRARNGEASIVLEGYVFLSFDMRFWAHTVPAEHAQLLEVSRRMRAEAATEAAEAARVYEAEAIARRAAEVAAKEAELEVKRAALRQQLAQQRDAEPEVQATTPVAEEKPAPKAAHPGYYSAYGTKAPAPSPAPTVDPFEDDEEISEDGEEVEVQTPEPERTPAMDALSASIRSQMTARTDGLLQQLESLSHNAGVYRNAKGLPPERYIYVLQNGNKLFFRTIEEACRHARAAGLTVTRQEYVYDYWNPASAVEHFYRG